MLAQSNPNSFVSGPPPLQRDYTLAFVRTSLSAMLMFHVADSVALGFGPELWLDFIVEQSKDETRPGGDLNPSKLPSAAPSDVRVQIGLGTLIVVAI